MAEKYTSDKMIKAIREKHGNLSAAARYLGCSRNTIARYIENYPTVKAVDVTGGEPVLIGED